MKSGRGGKGSWGRCEGEGAYCSWGRCEGEGQPTENRRDLSLPKPDPVWAPSHPKIHQNTTKKGKIRRVQTREREMRGRGEVRGNLKK